MFGAGLLRVAKSPRYNAPLRMTSMLGGWLAIYLSTHAIAHWFVGAVCGIESRGYRLVVGTANPEQYPKLMRPVMTRLPFWSVSLGGNSRRADPRAHAAMYAAGDTSTSIANLLVAVYVVRHRVPGGRIAAMILTGWTAMKTVATARNERGDYAKALRALRSQ
jgi:hypothetical protein